MDRMHCDRALHLCTHQDAVTVYDSVESVCDGEDGAFLELFPDGFLDQLICPVEHITYI